MPTSEAQMKANKTYREKNRESSRIKTLENYHLNKEALKVKRKEVYLKKKAELASLKAELQKKDDDQRNMVKNILTRHRQAIHDELLQTYKTQGMPAWIVDAICLDMTDLIDLSDPRLSENPTLTTENSVIQTISL